MRDIERYRRSKTRYSSCPGERLHKTDDVVGVDHNAIQQARGKAVRYQRRHAHGSIRTVERTRMRQLKIARVDICALLWVAALFVVIIALKHFGL